MALPKQKVNLYERRIARLKKDVEQQRKLRREMSTAFANAKVQYADIVASHMVSARKATDTVTQQAFKISELENQLAVQFKQNAELSSDLQKVTKRYNENFVSTNKILDTIAMLKDDKRFLEEDLARARQAFGYRLWIAITIWWGSLLMAIATRLKLLKQRIKIRWTIARLSKRRVDALYEAGHIPEKLVKSALAYYEHDRKRMEIDEEIRLIHGGADSATYVRESKPSLWRRWNIFLGRA
jgi:hypothetical protein